VIPPGWRRVDPRLTVVDGALALIAVLLVVQVWLLTTTLEAWLAGRNSVALPAACASAALLAGNTALVWLMSRTERIDD
jgi:hypothetical protein